jgi:hypothetical protein
MTTVETQQGTLDADEQARRNQEIAQGEVDRPMMRAWGKSPWELLLALFSSFGLSIFLLVCLGILTFAGTLAQTEMGIHAAQKRYFESWWLVEWVFGTVPLLLPGGMLVMILLCVNLLFGGILRMRKDLKRAGVLITHIGIALLFVSGLVKHMFAYEGHLTLYEGEKAAFFQDYYAHDIVVTEQVEGGNWKETIIPGEQFKDLTGNKSRTFTSAALPFDLVVSNWLVNCLPFRGTSNNVNDVVLGDYGLQARKREPVAEANIGGALLTIRDKNEKGEDGKPREQKELLLAWHGRASVVNWRPIRYESGGRFYAIDLRNRSYPLPYEIELADFRRELYPGTNMPKSYESDVIVRHNEQDGQEVRIWMNHPLRREGYIFFQSNWGPQDGSPGPMYSVFSVVNNPSDQWPLWSCLIIAFGLIWHFGLMLTRFIRKEAR